MTLVLGAKPLSLADLRRIALEAPPLSLAPEARDAVAASARVVEAIAASGTPT